MESSAAPFVAHGRRTRDLIECDEANAYYTAQRLAARARVRKASASPAKLP
jgi:hypothetical protein